MCGRKDRLLIEQIGQLQGHIPRLEEEIEKQIPFEAFAQRLVAVPAPGKVGGWTILAEIWDSGSPGATAPTRLSGLNPKWGLGAGR